MQAASPRDDAARLGAELETAALHELSRAWHTLNYTHFREGLRPPMLELSSGEGRLGQWDPLTRRLSLSRALLLEQPWGVVLEVLKHEMAHQYVHEVLRATDESAHGRAFREVCARLGIDGAASGLPSGEASGRSEEEERILLRVSRLLALAESPNEHEAQAAMNAAQKLMLKYNLSAAAAQRPGAGPEGYAFRHLGEPTGRICEAERLLASLLTGHFFVEAIWVPVYRPELGKRGTVLEICGSRANVELACYVHSFLLSTAERLWKTHKKQTGIKGDRDRQKFAAGVMIGFRDKLGTQAEESRKEGLVWVKDGNLDDFFRRRHPRIRHVTYRGGRPSEAYAHGREAGRQIILHKPVGSGPSAGERLLGPAKRLGAVNI